MDDLTLGLATALAGALAGGVATWSLQRAHDQRQSRSSLDARIQDKLLQLEIRIVKLEAESIAFIRAGRRKSQEAGGTKDA